MKLYEKILQILWDEFGQSEICDYTIYSMGNFIYHFLRDQNESNWKFDIDYTKLTIKLVADIEKCNIEFSYKGDEYTKNILNMIVW